MTSSGGRRRNVRLTAATLFAVAAAMVGLSFASVPLYRLFCQVTGYAGTPRTADVRPADYIAEEAVTVRFDANVNGELPWRFEPIRRQVTVRPGEEVLIHYRAVNRSQGPITGTATFNVTPFKAARYFSKLECFCFTEQTLQPGEEAVMPVLFYVDPRLLSDPETEEVRQLTLSYTFFRVDGDGKGKRSPPVAASEALRNEG